MLRITFIEQIRRLVYGDQPPAEANITVGLVNTWLNQGIAVAARKNYLDSIQLDGISYVNNSFYTKFSDLAVTADEQFLWKVELPSLPIGIGNSEGISKLQFKDSDSNQISQTVVFLSQNQTTFFQNMQPIPNKLLAYSQGKYVYIVSTLMLSSYTANVTMVSGGLSSDLDSVLNVPDDYIPVIVSYLKEQLMFQRQVPQDRTDDGVDVITTT